MVVQNGGYNNGTYTLDCNNNSSGGFNMSIFYQTLDIVAVKIGCSGWNSKRGFLDIYLKDGKIVRFNEWDDDKLLFLKEMLNGKKVGIKRLRKYYYVEKIVDTNKNE